ncbi:hypothetical protein [Mesorhizobium mediterraneum]|uniref:hypothetical protein n=1 Tax=Mesorhizobium mediterraneum TaxID=43617 RepID=UPI00177F6A1E|nr:hypothetical protein [Mesorhizobium mediterraneum]
MSIEGVDMAKSLPCALVFAALLFASGPSHAKELTYEQFDRLRETDSAKAYIIGIAEGISWTNIAGEVMYGKRVYCTPKDLIITNSNPCPFWTILSRRAALKGERILSGNFCSRHCTKFSPASNKARHLAAAG